LGLGLAIRYRQSLVMGGNLFAVIFIASLAGEFSYPELIGAYMVTGAAVVLVSALGLTGRFATWIPVPIMYGMLAGAIMPFVSGIFTSLGDAPVLVGGTIVAYLLGRRFLGARLPAILPALVAGLAIAAMTGQFGAMPVRLSLPDLAVTTPLFSPEAIVTVTPVIVVLITLQSNLPSMVFMRGQGYQPPERVIDTVSGLGTIVGSLFGPTAVSIGLPQTSLVAGPEAGQYQFRHRSAYLAAGALVLIGLMAVVAAVVPSIIPSPLLLAMAGLALVGVLGNALQQITRGPLLLGPMFAFAITLSQVSLLGFGPFFWSLVIGTGISLLLERDELRMFRDQAAG
jgi:benzoate membrane transport protein